MKTKKISLTEFRKLVKNIIKEESSNPLKNKIMSYLKSLHGSNFDEFAAEVALYWYGYGYHEGQSSDLYSILSTSEYKPKRSSNGIEDEDGTAQEYYDDIVSEFENEPMQESVKPKTQKIKLSEVRQMVRKSLREAYGDKKDYPKLHIFVDGEYKGSTTWSKNKKEAKDKYIEKNKEVDPKKVTIASDKEWH